jgi:L-alanine-DL-glutamate epimerase-like enolase superfamily enzyme
MQNRRDFLRTAAFAALGSVPAAQGLFAAVTPNPNGSTPSVPERFNVNSRGITPRMKLTFFPYELQLQHTFTVATYSRTTTPDVQVEIEYDGVIGYGEASMPQYLGQTVESVTTFLKKVNLEQFSDPFQMDDILTYIDSLSPGDTAAKAAVDIALHDLVGKLLQAPWYKIWGYDKSKAPSTTFTIGIDTPEVVKQKTLECDGKFNILKVKVGGKYDKEMIETIRTVTNVPLAVDANQGWTDKHYALDMINWLHEHGVVLIEQPLPKTMLDDTAWITERSPIPVFADESLQRLSDILPLRQAFHGINIKLMKCTGMREAHKMLTLARALGMKVMVGCMTETSCATSAAAQLSPAIDFADLDGNLLIKNDRFRGMTVVKGKIDIPELPGIGVVKI